ncbi:hypothetical protein MRQ36_13495 [Micromonospora sp. R77]|uniref:LppU/SCO3897 family protein n=1 Tax=Micromonospora sp. R77 TaxID=2925836 RepID=UPI001F600E92|nr:hypothetical protein [Micromonospora sp. R77]MCI4063540.1 hypothetical protein [Micromonospora sp. R77]
MDPAGQRPGQRLRAGRRRPPAWGTAPDAEAPQWNRPERPVVPEGEPWSPDEVWGRAAEAEPAAAQSTGWDQGRAEEPPAYQPSLGPGISPENAVPLPRQEQRVPGASLAAAPPADYAPPASSARRSTVARRRRTSRSGRAVGAVASRHTRSRSRRPDRWCRPRVPPESGAGGRASVPPAEPGGAGSVSASASVPLASRVTPPTDQVQLPGGTAAPQPRVYGRPARPEPEEGPGQDGPDGHPEQGGQPHFDEPEPHRNAFTDAPPVPSAPPSSPAGPPPFPPGVPSFVDQPANNRPVNGVHPHNDDRPADQFGDPFGGPGGPGDPFAGPGGQRDSFVGQNGPRDPFGGPGGPGDPFGGPGNPGDPFGGPGDAFAGPGAGRASVNGPGGFPPPSQTAPPAWQQQQSPGSGESDQGRFDAFKPEAEPKTEAPAPKVRNGKVLALVLIAAVLILAVPLGLLTLLGKIGGDDKPAAFDPAVGSCVKQSGQSAVAVECGQPDAFTVVSKVDAKEKCPDPAQPQVMLQGDVPNKVLCLKPAAGK